MTVKIVYIMISINKQILKIFFDISTPPASKSPAPNMDLGAQDQQKNPKSEGLQ